MTHEQAIAVRAAQLSGQVVAAVELEEALALIRASAPAPKPKLRKEPKLPNGFHKDSVAATILRTLVGGPVERGELFDSLRATKKRQAISNAAIRLFKRGMIRCEVRLTDEGLKALGMKGPAT